MLTRCSNPLSTNKMQTNLLNSVKFPTKSRNSKLVQENEKRFLNKDILDHNINIGLNRQVIIALNSLPDKKKNLEKLTCCGMVKQLQIHQKEKEISMLTFNSDFEL